MKHCIPLSKSYWKFQKCQHRSWALPPEFCFSTPNLFHFPGQSTHFSPQTPLERCHEGVFVFSFMRSGNSFSKEPRVLGSWSKVKYVIMIGSFLPFKYGVMLTSRDMKVLSSLFLVQILTLEKWKKCYPYGLFVWLCALISEPAGLRKPDWCLQTLGSWSGYVTTASSSFFFWQMVFITVPVHGVVGLSPMKHI